MLASIRCNWRGIGVALRVMTAGRRCEMYDTKAGSKMEGTIKRVAGALFIACLCGPLPGAAQEQPKPVAPPAARAQSELTVDALSVVRVRAKAISNARSMRPLGPQREGSGVVIGPDGLVLTIGYLIIEAETVEL